jgi:hypothetical protein
VQVVPAQAAPVRVALAPVSEQASATVQAMETEMATVAEAQGLAPTAAQESDERPDDRRRS